MSSNTAILLKKSGVSGNTPLNLEHGEIAINYSDGKLYYKNDSGVIKYITNQDTFGTINSNGQLILATTPTDILNIVAGDHITISTNTTSKTITIDSLVDNNLANSIANGTHSLANVTIETDGSITFGDGTVQYERAPISVVNQDWADGLDINTLLPGDLWYDETENKLYIYTDFGTYYDFFDITPQKF